MSDNRVISGSKYTVSSVSRATRISNDLTKRTFTSDTPNSHSQNQKNSDSFKNTSSSKKENLPKDESKELLDELDNKLRLKSQENLRLVQSKFNNNNNNSKTPIPNTNIIEAELHNKLSEAMSVQVDTSSLSRKIELLNALKHES